MEQTEEGRRWMEDRQILGFLHSIVYMDRLKPNCTIIPEAEKVAERLMNILQKRVYGERATDEYWVKSVSKGKRINNRGTSG